jgi:PPOX class probable FMN-dependent enzyme
MTHNEATSKNRGDRVIDDLQRLRALYPAPGERALRKQMSALDPHARRFIELSPFVVLSTADATGRQDASPRGGAPGFARAVGAQRLWIPDAPGNHRLDSLSNIVQTGRIGLLFLIPGVDETLRINGSARLCDEVDRLAPFAADPRVRLVIEVTVEEAYLHCAKALMRSKLWSDSARVPRSALPTMGQMISDQSGMQAPAESQEQMLARYAKDL